MADPVDEGQFAELMELLGTAAIQAQSMVKTVAEAAAAYRDHCIGLGFSHEIAEQMALQFYMMLMANMAT